MESLNISREMTAIRERTAKLTIVSVVLHLVAGFFILTWEPAPRMDPPVDYLATEITWLAPLPATIAASTPEPETPTEQPAKSTVATTTHVSPAVILSAPGERARALGDRLASLRGDGAGRRMVTETATADLAVKRTSVLAAFAPGMGRKSTDLARRGTTNLEPAAPSQRPIQRAAVQVTAIAKPVIPPKETSVDKQEISPGISLAGPVSDRELVSFETPTYPEWAKRDGVEVTVELLFTVLPSGRVKENILIEKTSGYQDFDLRAKSSLLSWIFETLGGGSTAEQWGRIEFNYRLKQAG